VTASGSWATRPRLGRGPQDEGYEFDLYLVASPLGGTIDQEIAQRQPGQYSAHLVAFRPTLTSSHDSASPWAATPAETCFPIHYAQFSAMRETKSEGRRPAKGSRVYHGRWSGSNATTEMDQ
jgi:hypothetical protein